MGLLRDDYLRLLIYNLQGEKITNYNNIPEMIISRLSSGVYLIKEQNDKGTYSHKVIVK